MTLRGYLRLGLGALIASNLILGLIAVLLLSRLGPSFERVREERVITFVAAQDMLAVLASAAGEPLPPEARTRFQAALERLRTRPKTELEAGTLARLSELSSAVLAGDRAGTREVVATLDRWIAEHRRALREQHAELEKLSTGGAWFLVFLTVFIVVATIVIARFIDGRALVPLEEILQVIDAAH
ncbi:MAG TPA: hypothetical protein VK116_16005, partial [Planctomycetota bacterium]|nr:hypothetical protein [Planctomycetota bacterium]